MELRLALGVYLQGPSWVLRGHGALLPCPLGGSPVLGGLWALKSRRRRESSCLSGDGAAPGLSGTHAPTDARLLVDSEGWDKPSTWSVGLCPLERCWLPPRGSLAPSPCSHGGHALPPAPPPLPSSVRGCCAGPPGSWTEASQGCGSPACLDSPPSQRAGMAAVRDKRADGTFLWLAGCSGLKQEG